MANVLQGICIVAGIAAIFLLVSPTLALYMNWIIGVTPTLNPHRLLLSWIVFILFEVVFLSAWRIAVKVEKKGGDRG